MQKSNFLSPIFLEKLIKYKPKQKIFNRNSFLIPYALNKIFYVHNGITFLSVMISEEIIGHKLGEFSQTRRRYFFKKKSAPKKKK